MTMIHKILIFIIALYAQRWKK